jgi:hypothetical protein
MEFKDTDLKTVFELMSRTAGNFVFDKDSLTTPKSPFCAQ